MTKRSVLAVALASAALATGVAQAQRHGTTTTKVPGNSDRVVAVPYNRPPVGEFETSGVSSDTVNLSGSPGFESDAFAGTHYVRVIDGSAAGLWSTISGNGSSSVTLADSAVASEMSSGGGETVRIYPHHTIGSVFKDELEGVSFRKGTSVLLFDNDAGVQNLPPGGAGTVNYVESPLTSELIWNGLNGEATVIPPDTAMVIRNNGSEPLTFVAQGRIPDHPVSYLLPDGAKQDLAVSSGYPTDTQTVGRLNFGGVTGRSVLFYDNTLNAQNLPPGGGGVVNRVESPVSDKPIWNGLNGADTVIPAAQGFLLRQDGGAGGLIRTTPPYPVDTE